jgi:iron complex transport system substrate-binding protein
MPEDRRRLPAHRSRLATAPHGNGLLRRSPAPALRVVGTVEFSNYPEEAKRIRQIGSYEKIDLEAVAALRPDLVLAWESRQQRLGMSPG